MKKNVSINVPSFNAALTISETIGSLILQSYPDVKISVLDNCSTDRTRDIVDKFSSEHKVNLVVNEKNIGFEANFERCLNLGEGGYTAVYHADDIYEPDMVKSEIEFLEQYDECGAVLTRANFIDKNWCCI